MDNNIIIVIDTNVLLHIYSCSPEFSEFAIECLEYIKSQIIVPSTVSIEYKRHQNKEFRKMKGRISQIQDSSLKQIDNVGTKIQSVCNELRKIQFPDVDELESESDALFAAIRKKYDDFFDDRKSTLELLAGSWGQTDRVFELYKELQRNNQIMPSIMQEELYNLCDTAQRRYDKQIPPGYKDSDKKGSVLRKYGDFFLWWEIIRYSKLNGKDIVFITDDVKNDWCKLDTNGNRVLRDELIDEFSKETKHTISMMNSKELYLLIADKYNVNQSDAVEYALKLTDNDYCNIVSDEVFDKVTDQLVFSDLAYINEESANVGGLGFTDALEILDWTFVSGVQTSREGETICYDFEYEVKVCGYSTEYWGRDDDTKEVISSPAAYHEFSGKISVAVRRTVDMFMDFKDDMDFDEAELYDGNLVETHFEPYSDEEPLPEYYCPDCCCEITYENDGGNGFCINCAPNH